MRKKDVHVLDRASFLPPRHPQTFEQRYRYLRKRAYQHRRECICQPINVSESLHPMHPPTVPTTSPTNPLARPLALASAYAPPKHETLLFVPNSILTTPALLLTPNSSRALQPPPRLLRYAHMFNEERDRAKIFVSLRLRPFMVESPLRDGSLRVGLARR